MKMDEVIARINELAAKNKTVKWKVDVAAGETVVHTYTVKATGEVGDVLIVGFAGDHRHTTVISHVVKDETGDTVDYLISCNTTNYRDFPASAYYYTFHRLIKIYGWNES